jgi:hypothetical protein
MNFINIYQYRVNNGNASIYHQQKNQYDFYRKQYPLLSVQIYSFINKYHIQ